MAHHAAQRHTGPQGMKRQPLDIDHARTVLALDKWQSRPDALVCPHDPEHGRLGVHAAGTLLFCGSCPVTVQLDTHTIHEALRYAAEN